MVVFCFGFKVMVIAEGGKELWIMFFYLFKNSTTSSEKLNISYKSQLKNALLSLRFKLKLVLPPFRENLHTEIHVVPYSWSSLKLLHAFISTSIHPNTNPFINSSFHPFIHPFTHPIIRR